MLLFEFVLLQLSPESETLINLSQQATIREQNTRRIPLSPNRAPTNAQRSNDWDSGGAAKLAAHDGFASKSIISITGSDGASIRCATSSEQPTFPQTFRFCLYRNSTPTGPTEDNKHRTNQWK
jgi:hypothetical protein